MKIIYCCVSQQQPLKKRNEFIPKTQNFCYWFKKHYNINVLLGGLSTLFILYWTRYNVFMKRKTEKKFFSFISKTQVFASGFTLKSFNSNTLSPLFKNKEYSILSQMNSLIWSSLNLVFRHLLIRLMALKCSSQKDIINTKWTHFKFEKILKSEKFSLYKSLP